MFFSYFIFLFCCILENKAFLHFSHYVFLCRSASSLSKAVKRVGVAVSADRQTHRQAVIVNDGDVSLSVTRIHPVVMLQADRKSLLLWASVTHTNTNTLLL